MQNKIFLTLIMGIITCTAYGATTMKGNTSCDTNVFGNDAELKANWSANTINVNFYNETDEVSKKTCEYDDVLELPEKPVKPGYQFIGWKIRSITPAEPEQELCGVLELDFKAPWKSYTHGWYFWQTDGEYCRTMNMPGGGSTWSYYSCSETPDFGSPGDWKTEFDDIGTLYGEASCVSQGGTTRNDLEKNGIYPDTWNGDEQYCWCRIIGFTAKEDIRQEAGGTCKFSPSVWFFYTDAGDAEYCAYMCTEYCADSAYTKLKMSLGNN